MPPRLSRRTRRRDRTQARTEEDHRSVCTKADSPIWQGFKPYRGDTKTNGLAGSKRRFYQWDHTHGDIEVYGNNKLHLGSMDPATGKMIKPAVPNRKIDLG